MRETEQSTGQNLDWAGAVHSNTDQKHAHVVVRGLQKDSDKETYFSPEQVKHGFREAARDCATERLGERTHAERVRADRREVEDERPTRIDRDIGKRSNDVLEGRTGERFQAKPQDGRERQRMEKLEEFGLAQGRQRDGSAAPEGGRAAYYAIDRNFRQKLGERERERQAQKQTAQDLRQKGIESKGTHVYRQGDDVAGRVVKKGYEDAAQGKKERPYVVVEQNGRHYYNNDRRARALGENQFVHMRSDGKLLSGRYAHQSAARAGKAEREQEQADSRERDGSASERGAASEGSRADSRGRERGNGR
jgi:type IV secretory pathway VirD2 relaxase